MKAIVIGMGVQGSKRKKFLKNNYVCSVDTKKRNADYLNLKDVPLNIYDSAYICTPDKEKVNLITYLLNNQKNILIEKPLIASKEKLKMIDRKIKEKKLLVYTAYNHRFEPSLIEARKIIQKKQLGVIYNLKLFYGNGTALLVKKSKWRDKKKGIITDLGSHLFDMCMFLFEKPITKIKLVQSNKFENKSPDHALVSCSIGKTKVVIEMTYTMWKNSFFLDLIGSKGSLHIDSLCKWSNSTLKIRKRKFPSGSPKEKIRIFKKGDPTWRLENAMFLKYQKKKIKLDIQKDIKINNYLKNL